MASDIQRDGFTAEGCLRCSTVCILQQKMRLWQGMVSEACSNDRCILRFGARGYCILLWAKKGSSGARYGRLLDVEQAKFGCDYFPLFKLYFGIPALWLRSKCDLNHTVTVPSAVASTTCHKLFVGTKQARQLSHCEKQSSKQLTQNKKHTS